MAFFIQMKMREKERSRTLAVAQTLIRTGLSDRIELRLSFDGYISEDVEMKMGFGDSAIGFKINLLKESGIRPETGFLAKLTLPTGENAFRVNERTLLSNFILKHH